MDMAGGNGSHMSFTELFERAAGYGVNEDAVVAALSERREGETNDADESGRV